MENYELKNDVEKNRYEIRVEGYPCVVSYMKVEPDIIYLTNTEVPYQLRNRGIGKTLVGKVLQDIEKKGFKVVPSCSFITAYIVAHPETQKLLKPGIRVGG